MNNNSGVRHLFLVNCGEKQRILSPRKSGKTCSWCQFPDENPSWHKTFSGSYRTLQGTSKRIVFSSNVFYITTPSVSIKENLVDRVYIFTLDYFFGHVIYQLSLWSAVLWRKATSQNNYGSYYNTTETKKFFFSHFCLFLANADDNG